MKWCELTILAGASSLSDVSNVIYSSRHLLQILCNQHSIDLKTEHLSRAGLTGRQSRTARRGPRTRRRTGTRGSCPGWAGPPSPPWGTRRRARAGQPVTGARRGRGAAGPRTPSRPGATPPTPWGRGSTIRTSRWADSGEELCIALCFSVLELETKVKQMLVS